MCLPLTDLLFQRRQALPCEFECSVRNFRRWVLALAGLDVEFGACFLTCRDLELHVNVSGQFWKS